MPFGGLLFNIRKLNNIGRWSNEFLHRRASVAEHSYYVTQIAQLLGFIEEAYGNEIDWKSLYRKAINHDVPESLVGDVISTTKNLNEDIKNTIKFVEEHMVEEFLTSPLPSPYNKLYADLFAEGKDATIEGQILRAADNIDALIECMQEVTLANTVPFKEKYFIVLDKVKKIELKSVQYFIDEILPSMVKECELLKNKEQDNI